MRNEIRPKPEYITDEVKRLDRYHLQDQTLIYMFLCKFSERFDKNFRNGGITAPLNYYKATLLGINAAGDREIPPERYTLRDPVFFGAALQDYTAHPIIGKNLVAQTCNGPTTVKEYDSSHWIMLSHPGQLNKDLLEWVQGL
jgi:pimeloyl-ACP methyl ester carboxylesterase